MFYVSFRPTPHTTTLLFCRVSLVYNHDTKLISIFDASANGKSLFRFFRLRIGDAETMNGIPSLAWQAHVLAVACPVDMFVLPCVEEQIFSGEGRRSLLCDGWK